MHRDLEKEMLKQRESLDAIAAAETAGNLAAAEAMRARLDEEHAEAEGKKKTEAGGRKSGSGGFGGDFDTPEPEPEVPTNLGNMFSRGNLIKLLTEKNGAKLAKL